MNTLTAPNPFSQRLADLLKARGLSTKALSDALGHGKTDLIQRALDGSAHIPWHDIGTLGTLLDVDAGELLAESMRVHQAELTSSLDAHFPHWSKQRASVLSGGLLSRLKLGITAVSIIDPDGREVVSAQSHLGVPSLRLRRLFTEKTEGFTTDEAAEMLFLSVAEAAELLLALEDLTFVRSTSRRDNASASWRLDADGERLVRAAVPAPLSHQEGMEALAWFFRQVEAINLDPSTLYQVSGVTVVGEMLTPAANSTIPFVEVLILVRPGHRDAQKQGAAIEARLAERDKTFAHHRRQASRRFSEQMLRHEFEAMIRDMHGSICCRFRYEHSLD